MAITTLADYLAAAKQTVRFTKTGGTSAAATWVDMLAIGGDPSGGTLAIGNTTTGAVPTDALAGVPNVVDFSGVGHITMAEITASAGCRIMLYDRLFHAGAFPAAVGTTTLTSQPSYSSRVPGGTDYAGTQIWLTMASNKIGTSTAHVTYTDQAGNSGHSTAVVAAPSNVAPQSIQLPLQSGDTGVSVIESMVIDTSVSGNSWDIVVARPLWTGRVEAGKTVRHWLDQTGMPQIFADSCLCLMCYADAGTTPLVTIDIEIASN